MCNTNRKIKLKPLMLKAYSCDFSNVYIYFKGSVPGEGISKQHDKKISNNKQVVFKNFHHLPTL